MISAFSWKNSISLCPASFHIPRPNYPVTPGVSCLPTFAFQSPIMKRTSFWVLVLKGLVGLIFHQVVVVVMVISGFKKMYFEDYDSCNIYLKSYILATQF